MSGENCTKRDIEKWENNINELKIHSDSIISVKEECYKNDFIH